MSLGRQLTLLRRLALMWMALFGAFSTLASAVALTRNDPLAKLPVFLMFLLVLYAPANNQLAQAPETTAAFLIAAVIMPARLPSLLAPARGRVRSGAAVAAE